MNAVNLPAKQDHTATLRKLSEARASLLQTHPFFGVLALKLKIRIAETPAELAAIRGTAGVCTEYMMFSPAFVETLVQGELKGLMAHEVMHLAMGHQARLGSRDPAKWNEACDHAVNHVLLEDNFMLPAGGCYDPKFKGMAAETIYPLLPDRPRKGGGGTGDGQDWGTFEQAGAEGSAEQQASLREWQQNAMQAAKAAQSAGKLPAHIKREIDAAVAPRQDWRSLFKRFFTAQIKQRQTWAKPNKRFYPGVYLPGTIREGLGVVVFIIDTSGSIGADTLGAFQAVANDIIGECEPAEVHVVYADAAVNRVDSYESGEEIALKPEGGGGTDFRPAFKRIERDGFEPVCACYLTDLMGTFPDTAPGYPVLWLSYGAMGAAAPWGETVRIDG